MRDERFKHLHEFVSLVHTFVVRVAVVFFSLFPLSVHKYQRTMFTVVVVHTLVLSSLSQHMYLPRDEAISFISRWKPQAQTGNIVLTAGIKRFAEARIKLESEDNSGAIVCIDNNVSDMFIVHHHTASSSDTVLVACLWHAQHVKEQLKCFRSLRAWHDDTFPDSRLLGDFHDHVESALWELSDFQS